MGIRRAKELEPDRLMAHRFGTRSKVRDLNARDTMEHGGVGEYRKWKAPRQIREIEKGFYRHKPSTRWIAYLDDDLASRCEQLNGHTSPVISPRKIKTVKVASSRIERRYAEGPREGAASPTYEKRTNKIWRVHVSVLRTCSTPVRDGRLVRIRAYKRTRARSRESLRVRRTYTRGPVCGHTLGK